MRDSIYLEVGRGIRSKENIWYRNLQHLGTGGNAVTFLVLCTAGPNKGNLFALKVFRRLSAPERMHAFLQEVEFLTTCDHPAVMRVYDSGVFRVGDGEKYPFVVAEYLPKTLYHVIRENTSGVPAKISYTLQLLSALKYLKNLVPPVVHRDIKPQNIFVKGKSAVLGDFGLMKRLDGEEGEMDREIFKESIGPGMAFFYRTPNLIAYANNSAPLTTQSDVFQLGLVLSELFTGRNPAIFSEDPLQPLQLEEIRHIPGGLGNAIHGVLERMLVEDWNKREAPNLLMDRWQGIFEAAVRRAHRLNGKVF